jgi:peptide-methionine (S)-S-oxide reductase
MRVLFAFLLAGAAAFTMLHPARADDPRALPAPAQDITGVSGPQKLVVSGGCFWGVQGVFEHVKGVQRAVSGYAGGKAATAEYETVSTGETGHAESVEITYDPKQVSYGELLRVFFSVALDPTEVDRQGPDEGSQYRSEIWAADGEQARVARAYIAQLNAAHAFSAPIATRVDMLPHFYPAEAYHQDFLVRNPTYPYIVINDLPKVQALKTIYPAVYSPAPVLTGMK